MPRRAPVARAIDYMFEKGRWTGFTRFLDDGRVCLTNNCAERALRGVALGRRSWLFAGSERGGDRAAFMYSLIVAAKLNDIDPQAWLADVLARMPNLPVSRLPDLLPWNWRRPGHPTEGGLMARVTHVHALDQVAKRIGESRELIELISSNPDHIDDGEMIHVHDGAEEGITTFTDRGVESLQEFLADVRTWEGGIRQFLAHQQCESDVIERIMAYKPET